MRTPKPRILMFGVAAWLAALSVPIAAADDEATQALRRAQMVREIDATARDTTSETGKSSFDPRVMSVLGEVPRHRFVPAAIEDFAYENRPLPIGYGQTISQPYIVALMTDLLRPAPGQKVLEIGTGSGYQAAVLARLVGSVFSIEIIAPLAERAEEQLRRLGVSNVQVRVADGYYGWKEHAPFDGIIVTAASASIPPPLLQQLKPGGRMLIPVGAPFLTQQLVLVEKAQDGTIRTRNLLHVRFVPLTRSPTSDAGD